MTIVCTKQVEEKLNVQDKHYRSNNLKVTGLTGNIDEKKEKFITIAKDKLSVDIEQTEITPMRMPREGPVIFRLINAWKRVLCYNRRSKLKGSNLYISEDLTQEQSKIFYQARQLRTVGKIFDPWTRNGTTMIRALHGSK